MKETLIKEYMNSRRLLEKALRLNGLNDKGSRQELEKRIRTLTHKELTETLDLMTTTNA